MGITYVRNKQFDKGVSQYHAAMSFTDDPATLARLEFNLGLAYLRAKKFDEAKTWFAKAAQTGGSDYKKPSEYLRKLEAYMAGATSKGQRPHEIMDIEEEEIFAA